jgi:hypothetical protein
VSENQNTDSAVHPADALALALDRANSLLIVLMDLYEARGEAFVAGNPFIVHGMSAVSDLLTEARSALVDLNENYDLSVVVAKPETAPTNIVELAAKPPEARAVIATPIGVTVPKPLLKPIAAAVVTLKEADENLDKTLKSYRQF